jgi:hypothetical protein
MTITDAIYQTVPKDPKKAWTPAHDAGGTERPGAWFAEITDMTDLSTWPMGMRLIVERNAHTPASSCAYRHRGHPAHLLRDQHEWRPARRLRTA